jgi:hypothetical protein
VVAGDGQVVDDDVVVLAAADGEGFPLEDREPADDVFLELERQAGQRAFSTAVMIRWP